MSNCLIRPNKRGNAKSGGNSFVVNASGRRSLVKTRSPVLAIGAALVLGYGLDVYGDEPIRSVAVRLMPQNAEFLNMDFVALAPNGHSQPFWPCSLVSIS